ncbi:MAG: hypothetical protein NPIRA02_24760 [Nitrospirales bacterium]|nr:MAG: hypothetical protein NPIRA02_24760 [Nitrospirales bacterium]
MKLVLDQNLSYKLVLSLDLQYPGSKHVKDLGLTGDDDEAIWKFASDYQFAIVSKDSDFLHRSLLLGHPPKVIQLRIGNCSTRYIQDLFIREEPVIK